MRPHCALFNAYCVARKHRGASRPYPWLLWAEVVEQPDLKYVRTADEDRRKALRGSASQLDGCKQQRLY